MKKILAIIIVIVLVFGFSACGAPKEEVKPISSPEEEMVAEQTESQTSEQHSNESVINTVLVDGKKVYEETKEDLLSNNGQNIGTDFDQRESTDDGIKYIAQDGENPFMPLSKRLNEVDGVNNNNQAFYMKFKPSGKDFGIMFSDEVNAGITIGEENEPILFVMDHDYMEPLETDLRIESDNWYHILIAMGSDGLMQGAIWKDGQDDNVAYINLHIHASFNDDRYANKSWHVDVGYKGEATFTVESYAYYTYSNFVMEDRFIEVDTNDGMPQNKDEVINAMLENPQELFGEGQPQMAENEGGQFGFIAEKRVNDDRMELFSGDEGAYMPLNTRLKDFGSDNRTQQAILIKFQPEKTNNLSFTFIGMGEFVVSFEEDGLYFTDVKAFEKIAFTDRIPNNFELKWDGLYYILVAFDDQANLRCIVWEENFYDNQASFETSLFIGTDDIYESNWKMIVGFDADGQLNIYEYAIYTFDGFMDNSSFISSGDNQNNDAQNDDNDFGPSWAINIGGNFDIMSDMVWQSIELQDINAGGDTFKGYGLKEMMEFSGNSSDSASITFGQEGAENAEIEPTYDAYIVFKKNDEFLGGPFLLSVDGLSEYSVIEVHPN